MWSMMTFHRVASFLRLYKQNVRRFKSAYVPHLFSYALCYLWEKYSQ